MTAWIVSGLIGAAFAVIVGVTVLLIRRDVRQMSRTQRDSQKYHVETISAIQWPVDDAAGTVRELTDLAEEVRTARRQRKDNK